MKRYLGFLYIAVALCLVASCQEMENGEDSKGDIVPVFPETVVVNNEVKPGDELEFSITPNMDWEISIPEEAMQYFKLVDGNGRYRDVISGEASEEPVVIRIWVSPIEEYDNNRSCSVTLTMGGESRTVAEFVRPAKLRKVEVYSAKVQADTLVVDVTGEYVYEECTESIDVIWSASHGEFIRPLKVVSNCQWDIDRSSFPEWLTLMVPEITTGTVLLDLKGVSLDDVTGVMSLKSGDDELKKFSVSLPSCRGIDVYCAEFEDGDWVYVDGEYRYSEQPQESLTMVWTGSDYRLPLLVDSKCEWTMTCPDWMTVSLDAKRSGLYRFNLMGDPAKYPLDDLDGEITISFKGEDIKKMNITIPGCKDKISVMLTMSLTEMEFNYSGQFKTTAGYQNAPVKASVTASPAMTILPVEIVDGRFSEKIPDWLEYDMYVDDATNTSHVLQTKTVDFSVSSNETSSSREAYVFFLPSAVENVEMLFEEDGFTVREEYLPFCVPVFQACIPADYLTPELSAAEMAAEGAELVKSEDPGLLSDPVFGQTRYAYEITYKNTWSSDGAKMYLTYPYSTIEFYDEQKQKVSEDVDFWLRFSDLAEDKTYGSFIIPIVKTEGDDQVEIEVKPGTAYAVFKDAEGATLCVVRFTYAPEIHEEPELPDDSDTEVDASAYFADPELAASAGASLVEIVKVNVPFPAPQKPSQPADDASSEVKAEYESALAQYNDYLYKRALYSLLNECKGVSAPLMKLTYTAKPTTLTLDLTEFLTGAGKEAHQFTANPYILSHYVKIDGKTQEDNAGRLVAYGSSKKYDGCPEVKMNLYEADKNQTASQPLVVLFHDSDGKVLMGIVCVQNVK